MVRYIGFKWHMRIFEDQLTYKRSNHHTGFFYCAVIKLGVSDVDDDGDKAGWF